MPLGYGTLDGRPAIMLQTRYEIYVTREGRDFLEGTSEEMDHACNLARILLKKDRAEAARVIEIKRGWTGREYEKEVYSVQGVKPEAAVNVASPVETADLCESTDDLFGLPARVTASQVLRRYLDHHGITVLELLHNHREQRRIQDAGTLMLGAVSRVATVQAERYGGEVRERTDQLQSLLDQINMMARAHDKRGAARLDASGVSGLLNGLPGRPGHTERRYLANVAITHALLEMRQIAGKLEILLTWFDEDLADEAIELVDDFIADTLMSGQVVMELLGKRKDLVSALLALVQLAHGRLDTSDRSLEPMTVQLNRAIGRHSLPQTVDTILDRVRRALAGTQSLTKGDEQAEQAAFKRFIGAVTTSEGPLGGPDMAAALLRRYSRAFGKGGPTAIPASIREIGACFTGTWEEMNFLVAALRSDLGGQHIAALLGALQSCLEEAATPEQFMWRIRNPDDRVSSVASFHGKLAGLEIPAPNKKQIAQWLEKMLVELQQSADQRK